MRVTLNFYDENLTVNITKNFQEFKQIIALRFGLLPEDVDQLIIYYFDHEKDKISISSEQDYMQAFTNFVNNITVFSKPEVIYLEVSETSKLYMREMEASKADKYCPLQMNSYISVASKIDEKSSEPVIEDANVNVNGIKTQETETKACDLIEFFTSKNCSEIPKEEVVEVEVEDKKKDKEDMAFYILERKKELEKLLTEKMTCIENYKRIKDQKESLRKHFEYSEKDKENSSLAVSKEISTNDFEILGTQRKSEISNNNVFEPKVENFGIASYNKDFLEEIFNKGFINNSTNYEEELNEPLLSKKESILIEAEPIVLVKEVIEPVVQTKTVKVSVISESDKKKAKKAKIKVEKLIKKAAVKKAVVKPQEPIKVPKEKSLEKPEKKPKKEDKIAKIVKKVVSKQLSEFKTELIKKTIEATKQQISEDAEKKKKIEKQKEEEQKVIHQRYICDSCNVGPIKGIRYHCTICDNFDLCETCEEIVGDSHKHPFLKLRQPNYGITVTTSIRQQQNNVEDIGEFNFNNNNNNDNYNVNDYPLKVVPKKKNKLNEFFQKVGKSLKEGFCKVPHHIQTIESFFQEKLFPKQSFNRESLLNDMKVAFDLEGISDEKILNAIDKAEGDIELALSLLFEDN